jgi:hypothetical protein
MEERCKQIQMELPTRVFCGLDGNTGSKCTGAIAKLTGVIAKTAVRQTELEMLHSPVHCSHTYLTDDRAKTGQDDSSNRFFVVNKGEKNGGSAGVESLYCLPRTLDFGTLS